MLRARNDAGFSLVETLVALAVFAMAGVGLLQLQTYAAQSLARVETRALADMLAQNTLVDIAAARGPPPLGARQQEVSFAARDWRLAISVQATPDPVTRRVSVVVSPPSADAPAAAQACAFVAAPESAP
jgi:general secretion pathway protein I